MSFCQCPGINQAPHYRGCQKCLCSYGCGAKVDTICSKCGASYCLSHGLALHEKYDGMTLNQPYDCLHDGEVIKALDVKQCTVCTSPETVKNIQKDYAIKSFSEQQVKEKALSLLGMSDRDVREILAGYRAV